MRQNHRHGKPAEVGLYAGRPKRARKGVGISATDQPALPINPVDSIALKVQTMVIRNEVTSRLFSGGRFPEQVLTAYNEQERLGQKRMPWVTPRICRQTHGGLEDKVLSSEYKCLKRV